MMTLWQDLRYGLRVLAKSPSFTIVSILTLALGIGANTAIFTIVYGVLLRPLPFPEPDRIVQLAESYKQLSDEMDIDSREWKRLQDYGKPFEYLAAYTSVGYNLATGTGAEHLRGMPVSSAYFSVLGVHPALGRDFAEEDGSAGGQRVAIISYGLWARRYAADPARTFGLRWPLSRTQPGAEKTSVYLPVSSAASRPRNFRRRWRLSPRTSAANFQE
jgi:putative ABC transport system permease protein